MNKDRFQEWIDACPFDFDITYDHRNAEEEQLDWEGQVDLQVYTDRSYKHKS